MNFFEPEFSSLQLMAIPILLFAFAAAAALGRAFQIGWYGKLPVVGTLGTKIIVWLAYAGMFLVAAGAGALQRGFDTALFTVGIAPTYWSLWMAHAGDIIRQHWPTLLVDLTIFGIAMACAGALIGFITRRPIMLNLGKQLRAENADPISSQRMAEVFIRSLTILPLNVAYVMALAYILFLK